ncbi:Dihydrodipicolinate synthetase [Lipomyces arxii]|uniref:Dihydrodipicolinate synthetase n=1 Tax=Lipomyces arxii TaxID=56418 RepID=UPI0034CF8E7C
MVAPTTIITKGVHVPSLTFFKDGDDQPIDYDVQKQHFRFLFDSGVHGIVIGGTNGESVALTLDEKIKLVNLAIQVRSECGGSAESINIGVGASGQSTTETLNNLDAIASQTKADYALLLPASFFHYALTLDDVMNYFNFVADRSRVPIILYNYPAVTAGIDMDVHTIALLAEHPNIVGVKLTCGTIMKAVRLCGKFSHDKFAVFAGQSDWLYPALAVGASGTITGVANLFPRTIVKLYYLYMSGKHEEALKLQREVAECEVAFAKGGISGTKYIVAANLGYPTAAIRTRGPLPSIKTEERKEFMHGKMEILAKYEQ